MEAEAEEVVHFDNAFEDVIADCTTFEEDETTINSDFEKEQVTRALEWFRDAMNYNLPHGKKFRGLLVVLTHRLLSEHRKQTANLHLARIVGWCVEMLQSSFLILDDIMDESQTRRGQKCWHLLENVGSVAINDSYFIMSTIYHLLNKHLQAPKQNTNQENGHSNNNNNDSPYYLAILKLFHDTMRKTTIGQNLDLLSSAKPGEIPDFSEFTEEKYYSIVDYKTSFYSFAAPIRLGMLLSGVSDPETHKRVTQIMRRMGQFFQVQDDYLDCFGNPEIMGKIGTDIEDGKCCWPIVNALKSANQEQKEILCQNYARKNKEQVDAVKSVYRTLNLEQVYANYEKKSLHELSRMIEEFCSESEFPSQIFYSILAKLCGRKK